MCVDAPDTSGMEALGMEQLAFARQQYADLAPYLRKIADTQVAAQEQQMAQAADYYNYMQETYRPLEKGLVARAQEFNTDAYRQQLASQAAAAAGKAFSQSTAMEQRALAARGINPASGAARGMGNATALQQAAMRSGAMTGARQQAEQLGYARMLDAAGLGRGLSGASTAAYGGATAAGSAATGTAQAAGNQYMQGMAMAGNTMNNVANIQSATYGQKLGMVGTAVGAGLGAYGAFAPGS